MTPPENLPADIAALQAGLVAERAKRIEEAARAARIEAELAVAKAKASDDKALIAYQRLQIAKLTRQLYGQRSERSVRLLEQIELAFEELEVRLTRRTVSAAERSVARELRCGGLDPETPRAPAFSEHLPRDPAGRAALICRRARQRARRTRARTSLKTLQVILPQWKVNRRCPPPQV